MTRKAIIVGVNSNQHKNFNYMMDEFKSYFMRHVENEHYNIKNIYFYAGSNYSYSIDELQPIEQFTAYIANIKNKSNDEE